MSSTRTTVDKNSCDAEIEPSVVRVEDTAKSSLNEAPQQDPYVTAGYLLGMADRLNLDDTDDEYVRAASRWLQFYLRRDGQPG